MMTVSSSVSIYLCTAPTDLRKSFDGLSGIVRSQFHREPNDGSIFLFINRRRDRIKALYWEPGGYALWYKRLESGSLETVPHASDEQVVTIDATELSMLLSGISLRRVKRRKRYRAA